MMERKNISGNTLWESEVGYSRAVRIGDIIEIAGTTSVKNGHPFGVDNPCEQTKYILETIEGVLHSEGLNLNNVIRTRIFITDICMWKEVGKAHLEFFKEIKPATTMIEVSSLINPNLLVEIEATAII